MQNILLVEDDDDVREMFAEVLREAGYVVDEAENGKQALDKLEAQTEPCLVLLDLMMPVMNGPELLRAVRDRERLKSCPVVALSAAGHPADVPEADEFLRKPLMPQHLLNTVKQYCEPADPRSWVS